MSSPSQRVFASTVFHTSIYIYQVKSRVSNENDWMLSLNSNNETIKKKNKKNKMKNNRYVEIKILQKNERTPVDIVNDTISIINKNEIKKRKL